MTLYDVYAYQLVIVGACVRSLTIFATIPLLVAEEMRRDRAGRPGLGAESGSSVVSIASYSHKTLRGRENRTMAGTVLSYSDFARRLKRRVLGMTSSCAGSAPSGVDNE
jgi:hypothetical protein